MQADGGGEQEWRGAAASTDNSKEVCDMTL